MLLLLIGDGVSFFTKAIDINFNVLVVGSLFYFLLQFSPERVPPISSHRFLPVGKLLNKVAPSGHNAMLIPTMALSSEVNLV